MNLFDMISSAHGGAAISHLSFYYGLSQKESEQVTQIISREINSAIVRNASHPDSLVPVLKLLGSETLAKAFDHPPVFSDPDMRDRGLGILHTLLGSNYARHKVAQQIAGETNLKLGMVEHMLPSVTALAVSALHHHTRSPLKKLLSKLAKDKSDRLRDRNPFERLANFIAENDMPENSTSAYKSLRDMLGSTFSRTRPAEHVS